MNFRVGTVPHQQCHVSHSATSSVPRQQCHVSSATSAVSRQQCHVIHSATSAVARQQCHVTVPRQQCPATMTGAALGMPGQLASESIADSKQRFQTRLAMIEAEEQRQVAAEAARLQAEAAATAEKQWLQAETDAGTQARRKEAHDLLQRHEAASIERLKFWHFQLSNGDDATLEEQHKEFLSKLRQNQELQQQYEDLQKQHQELASLRRTVQSHEDATRALNSSVLDLEQAVPGPDAGVSSSAPSNRQLEERVDHVVAMLGDISTFAEPITINNQLDTLKTEVQQLQLPNKNGNITQHYKMSTFQIEKFDDYTHQDPVLWWEGFTTQLRILFVAKHAYIGALVLNSKGGCQTWLSHLASTHGVDVADLKDKISLEELTRLWKKRSYAALSLALGDREQYATFAEIIDKAREIIKTNRAAAHEKSAWQPTYVEKVNSHHLGSQTVFSEPIKFNLTEAEYKYRDRYGCCYWCNSTKHKTSLCQDQAKEDVRPRINSGNGVAQEDYLHSAVPTPLMDAGVEVVDLHAYIAKIDREFKTQRYDDIDAPLLYVRIQIGEATCNALIDCGASRNYMSQDFMVRAGLGPRVRRKSMPTQVTLADGHTHKSIDQCIYDVPVYFAPHASEAVSFDILDTKFDMVLGMSWLRSEDHPVKFYRRTIHVRVWNGVLVPCTVAPPHPLVSCHVVSAASMRVSIIRDDIEEMGGCFLHALPPHDASPMDSSSDPRITELLDAYDVFEGPHEVVPDRPIHHKIILEDGAVPPRGCIYRMSEEELSVLRAQLDHLLEKGWIRPSSSPYGAPVLFVRKKNKDLRLCIDYRKLNAQTIRNAGPLPRIDDLLERLGGAKFLSKLDLKSGYHQLEIRKEDRYKTAFKTRYGHFEWLVMSFGLTNAPTTFQAAMTTDRSLDEHVEHLRTVLERLRQAKYKANCDKCEFARQELEYLGHYVTPQGIRPLADKIEALLSPINSLDDARKKELLAFVMSLKRWQHFLLGRRRFTWVTDNNPLTYYKTQDTVSSTIGRWMYFIDQFDFTPKHLPGLSNRAADALSRRPDLCAMTHHAFAFDEELQRHFIRGYESDPDFTTLYAQLSSDHPPASHYRIVDGYLLLHSRGKDLLCVPRGRRLWTRLLGEYHDLRLAGHFGVNRTIARLRQRFRWPDLITDVTRYCDSCEVCRRSKPRNRNPYGELRQMSIPQEPGLSIAMDVTGPFPRDRLGHDGILTVVDRLNRCNVFSKIDLKSGYHQIEVNPADQFKIAFKTHDGLY
ncbi:hypothetical protein CBR_g19909 [Chara braunii]|uniref:RNA-directed DNA polymerase n=1 Tax=Chara braunii TaxID=69332 RepID=A0A388KYZ2_CHABU|nr:hypothetical protein CBR_g19909 [Chara braunii]|eukprot:GBG75276.1 hypothetical protein CBR_g19909 [Chara braunii]